MNSRLLVAFDDSENAMRAVEFVINHFSTNHKITLFSVLPDSIASYALSSPELAPYFLSQENSFIMIDEKKKELIDAAIQEAEKKLINAGFNKEQILLRVENKKIGVARDIINEAHLGYDLVILGRRGLSGIKEFFLGSVSQKVLHSVRDVSVIIVD